MSNIFWKTVTEDLRLGLAEFSKSKIAQSFYLAGGTALSLQIRHRLSVDLIFSPNEDIPSGLRRKTHSPLFPPH